MQAHIYFACWGFVTPDWASKTSLHATLLSKVRILFVLCVRASVR